MADSDEALLMARLTSYSEALANHSAAIEEAYRYAEESYQHLSRVYSGRAIKETLDDRIATR